MCHEIYMGGDYSTAQTLIILDKVAERRPVYGKQKGSKNGALRDTTTTENREVLLERPIVRLRPTQVESLRDAGGY